MAGKPFCEACCELSCLVNRETANMQRLLDENTRLMEENNALKEKLQLFTVNTSLRAANIMADIVTWIDNITWFQLEKRQHTNRERKSQSPVKNLNKAAQYKNKTSNSDNSTINNNVYRNTNSTTPSQPSRKLYEQTSKHDNYQPSSFDRSIKQERPVVSNKLTQHNSTLYRSFNKNNDNTGNFVSQSKCSSPTCPLTTIKSCEELNISQDNNGSLTDNLYSTNVQYSDPNNMSSETSGYSTRHNFIDIEKYQGSISPNELSDVRHQTGIGFSSNSRSLISNGYDSSVLPNDEQQHTGKLQRYLRQNTSDFKPSGTSTPLSSHTSRQKDKNDSIFMKMDVVKSAPPTCEIHGVSTSRVQMPSCSTNTSKQDFERLSSSRNYVKNNPAPYLKSGNRNTERQHRNVIKPTNHETIITTENRNFTPKTKTYDSNIVTKMKPTTRLMGEICFQLDRKILNSVFYHTENQKRRFYGYIIQNIMQKIDKECCAFGQHEIDEKKKNTLVYRYNHMIQLLQPLGFDVTFHPDFCADMVNKYGLLPIPPNQNDSDALTYNQKDLVYETIEEIAPKDELPHLKIILDCLAALAEAENSPMISF